MFFQKVSLGPETCEIEPKLLRKFMQISRKSKRTKSDQKSDFGHVRTYCWGWGNPQGGSGGTLEGQAQSQPFKKLYENPREIPKGIPS